MIERKLQEKVERVNQAFRSAGSALVAFSGGVDSALVLKLAIDVLGRERVLAVTARSPSVPSADLATVAALADEIGAQHEFIDTREFDDPDYLANPSNRCYFCKTELYGHLSRLAAERGFGIVANGVNADDLGDYRPGISAADEHDVAAPLARAGIRKAEVRALADERELSVHDKPASPCLSSRVQYGEQITPGKLERIDRAESFLRELGFRECRVRHHNNLARIEVPPGEIALLSQADVRRRIDACFRELGYQYVTLDLRGFRSGSMNEVLIGTGLRELGRKYEP